MIYQLNPVECTEHMMFNPYALSWTRGALAHCMLHVPLLQQKYSKVLDIYSTSPYATLATPFTPVARSQGPMNDPRSAWNIYSENPLLFLHNIWLAAATASQDVFHQTFDLILYIFLFQY